MGNTDQYPKISEKISEADAMPKIGCAAANPRLLLGKPLYYGTIGLMMGNIYLTSMINVILAMGNIIVVWRRKLDAMTLLPNVNLRDFVTAEILLLK